MSDLHIKADSDALRKTINSWHSRHPGTRASYLLVGVIEELDKFDDITTDEEMLEAVSQVAEKVLKQVRKQQRGFE